MAGAGRTVLAFVLVAMLSTAASTRSADGDEQLYKAEIIVTGTGEAERARGFREGLREIFIKLTGDASLEQSDKLDPYLSDAGSYIRSYTYEDRMKNLPIRDEQGTRDRPHYLRMTADADKIETALKNLGFEIWRRRPEIDVLLTVRDFKRSFLVGLETPQGTETETYLDYPIASSHFDGYEQREVLKSIATRRGLTLHLPDASSPRSDDIQQRNKLIQLFHLEQGEQKSARYRADLAVLPSGFWRLAARGWGYSRDGSYLDEPSCFSFEISEVSFDTALRKSLDAFAAWVRSDKTAPLCGLPPKI